MKPRADITTGVSVAQQRGLMSSKKVLKKKTTLIRFPLYCRVPQAFAGYRNRNRRGGGYIRFGRSAPGSSAIDNLQFHKLLAASFGADAAEKRDGQYMRFGRDVSHVMTSEDTANDVTGNDVTVAAVAPDEAEADVNEIQKKYMRFGRSGDEMEKRYMRFGKRAEEDEKRYMRFGRGGSDEDEKEEDKRYMRFRPCAMGRQRIGRGQKIHAFRQTIHAIRPRGRNGRSREEVHAFWPSWQRR